MTPRLELGRDAAAHEDLLKAVGTRLHLRPGPVRTRSQLQSEHRHAGEAQNSPGRGTPPPGVVWGGKSECSPKPTSMRLNFAGSDRPCAPTMKSWTSWPDSKEALLARMADAVLLPPMAPGATNRPRTALRYYPGEPEFMGLRAGLLFVSAVREALGPGGAIESRGRPAREPGAKGMILTRMGRTEEALACSKNSAKSDPDNPSAAKGPRILRVQPR